MLFFEGSALTGENLEDCLEIVTEEVRRWLARGKDWEGIEKIDLKSSVLGGENKRSSNCW